MLVGSTSTWKGLVMPCLHPYPVPGVNLLFSKRQSWPCHRQPAPSSCSED